MLILLIITACSHCQTQGASILIYSWTDWFNLHWVQSYRYIYFLHLQKKTEMAKKLSNMSKSHSSSVLLRWDQGSWILQKSCQERIPKAQKKWLESLWKHRSFYSQSEFLDLVGGTSRNTCWTTSSLLVPNCMAPHHSDTYILWGWWDHEKQVLLFSHYSVSLRWSTVNPFSSTAPRRKSVHYFIAYPIFRRDLLLKRNTLHNSLLGCFW